MNTTEFEQKKVFSEASGSSAVMQDNVSMTLNEYGNYEEIVSEDSSGIETDAQFVSPNFNPDVNETYMAEKLFGQYADNQFDKRIGYYQSLYAGHVLEDDYRDLASSGGMGTWIFKELFDKDMIDGVIHVKKNNDENSPVLFKYDISRSQEEIREGAKTKYYPVEFSEVMETVRQVPGRYAIVGIPSFIMAVRLLAEKDALIKERIRYTVGLICGHQKSSKFGESLAWQVGIKPGNLTHIDFRKKLLDKPANNYGVEMTGLIDGKEVTIVKPTKELLGQNWGQGYFKVRASDFTDDVMNETADITLGDAWLPEYTTDSKGNNVVVVRHPEIDALIKDAITAKKLNLDVVDKETIFRSQSSHYRHTHDELSYRLYKKDKKKQWRPKKRVAPSKDIPLLRRKVQDLREEISMKSHTVYKEAVERDDLDYFKEEMGKLTDKYNKLYKMIYLQSNGVSGIVKGIGRRALGLVKK